MRAEYILETCLYVDDLEMAERFYREVLGLDLYSKAKNRHVFFRLSRGMFLLFQPDATEQSGQEVPSHGSKGPGHVAFVMAESQISDWRAWLHKKGVKIEREIAWPQGGYSLYFRDPAGNCIELATPRIWAREEEELL